MLQTPVAVFIFNRPDLTRRVMEEVARARPRRLLVVADGPRTEAERELCEAARAEVPRAAEWGGEVLTNFTDENMGCKRRFESGIGWVFAECEQAIVLEDDCLPHPSFFPYCEELLERYRDDERVMTISGDNFQFGRQRGPYSYYFSRYPHIWGWASWRRAWRHFDAEARLWPLLREQGALLEILGDPEAAAYWTKAFDDKFAGEAAGDVWDYQWTLANWAQNALTILPAVNLVSNIGWRGDATHTKDSGHEVAGLPTAEMSLPLSHPPYMVRDREADRYTYERIWRHDGTQQIGRLLRLRRRLSGLRRGRRAVQSAGGERGGSLAGGGSGV